MVGIERNKDPELPMKQRNTSWFVLLDDRKHGRAGKFPVFYDIDTGDYLEPPEGFLDSPYETLREWYAVHPEHDPSNASYQEPTGSAAQPLSPENQDKTGSDLTDDDIPPVDEQFLAAQEEAKEQQVEQQDLNLDEPVEEVKEETPEPIQPVTSAIPDIPDVPDMPEDDMDDDECPF